MNKILQNIGLSIISVFFITGLNIFAQNFSPRVEQITIDHGLSQGSINSLLHDKQGFLWIATKDGLNRYDGYSFKIYRNEVNNPHSLSSNYVTCITEDKYGNLWIGTSNGLNKFVGKENKFYKYAYDNKITADIYFNTIYSILIPDDGNSVWYSTRQGLFHINTNNKNIVSYKSVFLNPADAYILVIIQLDKEHLLLGLSNGLLLKFDIAAKSFENIIYQKRKSPIPENTVTSIVKDSKNNFWIGTYNGMYQYIPNENKFIEYHHDPNNSNSLLGEFITDIVIDKKNNLWISVLNRGLCLYNPGENKFTNYLYESNYFQPTNLINKISVSQNGVLWLGTNGFGLYKLNPFLNNFKLYTREVGGMPFNSVRTFVKDNNGNLWIGGYGGIAKLDSKTGKFYLPLTNNPAKGIINASIYIMAKDLDQSNIIWIGTEGGGLYQFDVNTESVIQNSLKNIWAENQWGNAIFSLFDNGDGDLWVGTNKGLLIFNKRTFKAKLYSHNPNDTTSISPQSVTSIAKDKNGIMWIGLDMGGLCSVDPKTFIFKKYYSESGNPNSLSGNFVKTIYEDKKGRLWIGTNGGGLNLMVDRERGVFQKFTTENGLPNNVIYGILEDKGGNLWMSTNNGIFKFNFDKNIISHYISKDGLQSNEFNTNAYYKDDKGIIYFGGVYGFNSLEPESFTVNSYPPKIAFTKFELFNLPVKVGQQINGRVLLQNSIENTKKIYLNYDENIFAFEFAALDFASPYKNKYSFILEGFDKNWNGPTENRRVVYTNLNPGEYEFKVKGTNNDGIWSTETASIQIIVVPPFWQTWWFILLLTCMALALLFYAYFQRTKAIRIQKDFLEAEVRERTAALAKANEELTKSEKELKELNTNKDKYFSILAHDLRGPFGGLIGLSEILLEDIDELDKDGIKELSQEINQILHEQFILLENLLGWSRIQLNKYQYEPEDINLSEIGFRVHKFLLNNAKSKNINFTSEITDGIYVNGNSTMLLSVVQNLVSNAIKFTKEHGSIKISVQRQNNSAVVIVEDSGIGMVPETVNKIFAGDFLKSTDGTAMEHGSGIGLMLVREFIKKMNGELKVESQLGKGSKFMVYLPISNSE